MNDGESKNESTCMYGPGRVKSGTGEKEILLISVELNQTDGCGTLAWDVNVQQA